MANVLDVGFLFRLVCAIPLRHHLAIHRQLDYGVVFGEGLFIILCLFLKLFLQRLQGARRHASHSPHQLIVFRLALCLFTFHIRLALEHLLVRKLNKRLPQFTHPILKLLLVFIALGIVFGYVFHSPIALALFLALIPQRLIDEGAGASNLPCRFHSILEELDLLRHKVRHLYKLVLVARSFFRFTFFHHQPPWESKFVPWVLHQSQSTYSLASSPNPLWASMCAPIGRVAFLLHIHSL